MRTYGAGSARRGKEKPARPFELAAMRIPTIFKKPAFWTVIAWISWAVALLVLVVRFCTGCHRAYAFDDYMLAGSHWIHGEYLYANWRGFIYSPITAAFFAPFACLPPAVAYTLWLLLSVAILLGGLATLLKTTFVSVINRAYAGIIYLLLLPFVLGNLDVGQANALVIGLLMFSVAAVREERWNTAVLCVAIPAFFKIYPLAIGMLICAIAPRRFGWRLLIALVLLGVAPFLFQRWAYVADQYHAWVITRTSDDRLNYPINYVPLDLWFLLHRISHLPIRPWFYTLIQAGTGVGVALFCIWGKWKYWRTERVLSALFFLGSIWMVLCGPATESHTYLLLAPALVLGLVQSFSRGHPVWLRALICAAYVLQFVNHNTRTSYLFHLKAEWIFSAQPISALLFLGNCIYWLLSDSFWLERPAPSAEVPRWSSSSAIRRSIESAS
jgi:Glycosyltransferase family 87